MLTYDTDSFGHGMPMQTILAVAEILFTELKRWKVKDCLNEK